MTAAILTMPPASRSALRFALGATAALFVGLVAGAIILAIVATRFFDYAILTVSSGSMAPAIRTGDLIVVKPAPITGVKPGDVVLFESGGDRIPTVHRVTGINEIETRITDRATGTVAVSTDYRLVTKGDANPEADGREVTADRLRGEVWFTIPRAGALGNAGLAAVLGGVFAVCAVAWAAWEVALRLRRRAERRTTGVQP